MRGLTPSHTVIDSVWQSQVSGSKAPPNLGLCSPHCSGKARSQETWGKRRNKSGDCWAQSPGLDSDILRAVLKRLKCVFLVVRSNHGFLRWKGS